MVKYYCDCCEQETDKLYPIPYLCHIDHVLDGDMSIYVDKERNAVSGRYEYKNVCIRCYNSIVTTSIKKFRELKSGFNSVEE